MMRNTKLMAAFLWTATIAVTFFIVALPAYAQEEVVLHSFDPGLRDGLNPQGSLTFDAFGNLYGTTYSGGVNGCFGSTFNCGTVFELSPTSGGGWIEKLLHNFGRGQDGSSPSAGLVLDASGNLYGTTDLGGAYGYGTVFELSPAKDGSWTEKVLHHFNSHGRDGLYPYGDVMVDASGNVYGTTSGGGSFGSGTVFELVSANGKWVEKILHNFAYPGTARDGWAPWGGVISDGLGNLYGTTSAGGPYGYGIVFRLSLAADGSWSETTLHSFSYDGKDGVQSYAKLTFDRAGNLYGSTPGGGAGNRGTVFELIPLSNGVWKEKIVHDFTADGTDGVQPGAGVIVDGSGNIFGTTIGSSGRGFGTVYELTPNGDGSWSEEILLNFDGLDGERPEGSLVLDSGGNIYGTTYLGGSFGGTFGYGTVFEILP
jgi:uncharacterized repeat protein (TIGR03803 family)